MFAGRFVARLGTDIDVGTTFVHNTVRACACRNIRFGSKNGKLNLQVYKHLSFVEWAFGGAEFELVRVRMCQVFRRLGGP